MKLNIVAVRYLEPEYKETLKCLSKLDIPIIFVDRKGVGSLAEAYNRGFEKVNSEFVWFISNITFKPNVIFDLLSNIRKPNVTLDDLSNIKNYAGIHPKFPSHHKFIKYGNGIQECNFIEFTAPLIRSEVFKEIKLDESMPYWGHDIAFGIECEKRGYKLAIDHTTEVGHVYIWDSKKNPITEERKRLRTETDLSTKNELNKKYPGWEKYL